MSDLYGSDFITITDDDGKEYELEVLSTIEYEGSTYLALGPAGTEDDPDAELEVSILKKVLEDGEEILSLGSGTEITEDTVLWWAVVEGSGNYELTVDADGKQSVFVLAWNENTPDGVIYKK